MGPRAQGSTWTHGAQEGAFIKYLALEIYKKLSLDTFFAVLEFIFDHVQHF